MLLSDFGIAIVQKTFAPTIQQMVGTVAYMAPEQISSKPRLESDQYALGVIVYEWLTGERPFKGLPNEIITQHLSVPPSPIRGKNSEVSQEVEDVVLKALAKDPQKSFKSVQDFAHELEQACLATTEGTVLAGRFLEAVQYRREMLINANPVPSSATKQQGAGRPALIRQNLRFLARQGQSCPVA